MSRAALLPNEFTQAVELPQSRDDQPERLTASVAAAQQRRHAGLLSLHPEAYAVPLETALFLYRRDPKPSRPLVLSALSGLEEAVPLTALAAAARDAWEARDWNLLGQLAFRFDLRESAAAWTNWQELAAVISTSDEEAAPASSERSDEELEGVASLMAAFFRAFDFERGAIPADGYVRAVLGYLTSLPEHFVPPPALQIDGEAPSPADWSFWHAFTRRHPLAWQSVTGAWEALSKIQRPFLSRVIEQLRQPAEGKLPRQRRLRNPFASLAGKTALDPRRRRASARARSELVERSEGGQS
ncbi:MAG TPA: hypothetical protein VFG20_03560 [Planctomycetaceae bacterium]|nr:hypothetical protein [Planctomycetaceae bacterium]